MEAIKINLEEYDLAGAGYNGESYNHKTDKSLMLKLYFKQAPVSIIESELENAHKVYELGVPSPKPGEYITDGNGRYGIRFERLVDKKSFSRAVGDNPEKVEEYARRFARMCLKLHSTKAPKDKFIDIKEQCRQNIALTASYYTPAQLAKFQEYLDNAPEGDTAIHGDLHFGNAVMVGDKEYFIDLGDFSSGSPLFDLGMVLFVCKYDNDDFLRTEMHVSRELATDFWKFFVKEYFGEDADPDEIEKKLRPYAALKLLIVNRNCNGILEEFNWLLE